MPGTVDGGRTGTGHRMSDLPPPVTDVDLLARMAAGDQEAFALVYDRHVGVVYGSVARFIGDPGAAEEIVQDAFLAAWRRAAQYEPAAGSVLGWLLGIARNRAIDRHRAAARRPRLVALGEPADGTVNDGLDRALAAGWGGVPGSDGDGGPEAAALLAWERAVVRGALDAMPADERRPLELAYDDGLTQAEVAASLGWPLGTVKTRTRRGLAALRAALEGVPELRPTGDAARRAGAGTSRAEPMTGGGDGPR
jgi:RNA polymerase sigma-70 factor (ECF subfamily)